MLNLGKFNLSLPFLLITFAIFPLLSVLLLPVPLLSLSIWTGYFI